MYRRAVETVSGEASRVRSNSAAAFAAQPPGTFVVGALTLDEIADYQQRPVQHISRQSPHYKAPPANGAYSLEIGNETWPDHQAPKAVWEGVLASAPQLADLERLGVGALSVRYRAFLENPRIGIGGWVMGFGIPAIEYLVFLTPSGGGEDVLVARSTVSSRIEGLLLTIGGGSEYTAAGLQKGADFRGALSQPGLPFGPIAEIVFEPKWADAPKARRQEVAGAVRSALANELKLDLSALSRSLYELDGIVFSSSRVRMGISGDSETSDEFRSPCTIYPTTAPRSRSGLSY